MPTPPANPVGLATPWAHLPNAALIDELLRDAADPQKTAARDAAWNAARDAARDAAWNAARDAAWNAARDAARGAALNAARDAAWNAARDAARDAALNAARGAARGAALNAARDAAWDAAWNAARGAVAALSAWDQAADLVHATPAVRNALAALDPSTYGHALTLLGPWLSVRDTTLNPMGSTTTTGEAR